MGQTRTLDWARFTINLRPNLPLVEFMNQDAILAYYTEFATHYDETIARDQDYTAFQKIPAWLLAKLPDSPCRLVDLGCGTGLVAKPFIARGDYVTGVDLTPKMLEQAAGLGYKKLICHSLDESLPFETACFEGAFLIGVMEFIQRPFKLFKEIRRVLRSGGLLACSLPEMLPTATETLVGIRTYNPKVMEDFFRSLGFSIERKECFQGFISQGVCVPYVGYLLKAGVFAPSHLPLASHALTVKQTADKGRGVFATCKIPQGSFIERAPLLIFPPDQWPLIAPTTLYDYVFEWGPKSEQAALALGFGSLYNHSIEPNVYYIRREAEEALDYFALKDIEEGQQLLINYNGEPSCQDLVWFQMPSQQDKEIT